jgi:hypothetical protein
LNFGGSKASTVAPKDISTNRTLKLGWNSRQQLALAQVPKRWTEEETQKLKRLREQGASLLHAAVALKWSKAAVRAKAHELGIPFPSWRTRRTEQRAKEAAARAKAGLPEKPV